MYFSQTITPLRTRILANELIPPLRQTLLLLYLNFPVCSAPCAPQPCSLGTQHPPGGAHSGVLGIALTEINHVFPSDKVAKSVLSFGADTVKNKMKQTFGGT